MPNFTTSAGFADTPTKCFASASSGQPRATNQSRSERAFVIVSSVVKVFDTMIASVSSGSTCSSTRARSAPSTFDTKWVEISGVATWCSACTTIFGPRSEPPMPMLITWRIRLPV